jgi:hypothetical protein
LLAPQQQPLLAPQQQPLLATQQPLLATQQQPLLATQQQPFLATQQSGGSYMIPTMMQSLLSQQQPIIMQQQPQQMMQQMMQSGGAYMSPAPIVYQAPVPNAPQTIVIDTSPQAMDQYGYLDDMQMASRGMPVMGSMGLAAGARQMSGGANQHGGRRVTPRPNRAFGGRSSGQAGQASQQQGPISSSARVTVQKLG